MGTEVIKYSQLGLQDIRFGTGTFEVTLADGRKVVLNEVDLGDILSDATKSTRTVTLDELTVTTLNFSGTFSPATLTVTGSASSPSLTITSTPTARTHALTVGNVQDGLGVYVASIGGTADAITLTPSPRMPQGRRFALSRVRQIPGRSRWRCQDYPPKLSRKMERMR